MKSFASLFKGRRAPVAHKQGADRSGQRRLCGGAGRFPHRVGEMSRSDKGGRAVYGWPPSEMREAPRRGEQTGRANHPVDGSLDRLCDPVGQKARGICTAQMLPVRRNPPQPARPAAEDPHKTAFPQRSPCAAQMAFDLGSWSSPVQSGSGAVGTESFLGRAVRGSAPPRGPQRRSGEPSTGWFTSTVCSPFSGERSAFPFGCGALPRPPPPFVKGGRKLYPLLTWALLLLSFLYCTGVK